MIEFRSITPDLAGCPGRGGRPGMLGLRAA
jgi:hypothetical protein